MEELPKYIRDRNGILPLSVSATKQVFRAKLRQKWRERWTTSPRYERLKDVTEDFPLSNFRRITKNCTRAQFSLLLQLRSGHIQLNKHLHRIGKTERPICPNCNAAIETVEHFLLNCPTFNDERDDNMRQLGDRSYGTLFETQDGIRAVLGYVNDTKRLKEYFGDVSPTNLNEPQDDDPLQAEHNWIIDEEDLDFHVE
jgi:hypothetical protein